MDAVKETVHSFQRNMLWIAATLIVVGLLFVIFPKSSGTIICYILGVILCLWGIVRAVTYFRLDSSVAFGSFGLVQGAALILLGIVCFARPALVASFLTAAFGLILVIDGVLKMQYAIDLLRMKAPYWWIVLTSSLIMVALGIIALLNPFGTSLALMIFVGISLIVDGLADLATVIYLNQFSKNARDMFRPMR